MKENIEGSQNFSRKIQTLEAEIKKLKKELEIEKKKSRFALYSRQI